MKTLIAGFGSIGRRHLNNLRALGEQDFVLLRSNKSTLPEDDILDIPVETSITAALSHCPDAVIVSNPTALHLDVAIPAAIAGCSILMEKPVSHTFERIPDLVSALQKGGGKLLTGFQFRFHPTLRKIDQCLRLGLVGSPVSCRVHWGEYLPGWHPWEDYRKGYSARADLGGGVVHTLSHPLDYLRWFFGEASNLFAFTSSQGGLQLDVEDTAEISIRYSNGVLASVHLDYVQRPPQHTLKIVCTNGVIEWDNSTACLRLFHADTNLWEDYPAPDGFERNQLFLDEMKHFIAVVKGQEEPICTLDDGIAALTMADAVYQSAKRQRMVEFTGKAEQA